MKAIETDEWSHLIQDWPTAEEVLFLDCLDGVKSIDPCVLCRAFNDEGLVLVCDDCDAAYHAHCVGFKGGLEAGRFCPNCDEPAPKRARA